MESLLPIAYIVEREQRALVAQLHVVSEPERPAPQSPLMACLSNVLNWLRLSDSTVRYA